jgi:hypothetical protein
MAEEPKLTPEDLYAAVLDTDHPHPAVYIARSKDEARYCREELGIDAVAPEEIPASHPPVRVPNRAMRRHPRG